MVSVQQRAESDVRPGGRRRRRAGSAAAASTGSAGSAARILDTVAVVPARNEEAGVLASLNSLARQTRRPDLILVVVNNSTDRTEEYARGFADDPETPYTVVLNLPRNEHKKAGALNHAIAWLGAEGEGRLADTVRHVLVMDADTELHPKFVERACHVLAQDPHIGGVSASCLGQTGLWRTWWQRYLLGMQILEYGRAAGMRYRRDVHTMSGAGSFYRSEALQSVLDWRGEVFWEDPRNLVEDYETTLTLKECGWKVTANELCIARTDLMPSLRELVHQRERWIRGTMDALRDRGWTRHTWKSILGINLGVLGFVYLAGWGTVMGTRMARQGFSPGPVFCLLIAFWIVFSMVCVRRLGWKAMLVEALVLPELLYAVFRSYWLISAILKSYVTRVAAWK